MSLCQREPTNRVLSGSPGPRQLREGLGEGATGREAGSRPDALGLLTCLESRILKSGKNKAGMRAVTARGMTSVHQ